MCDKKINGIATIVIVADRLGRHGIGLELKREYAVMGCDRIVDEAPLFLSPQSQEQEAEEQPGLFER